MRGLGWEEFEIGGVNVLIFAIALVIDMMCVVGCFVADRLID
jgi:hypothetical protein